MAGDHNFIPGVTDAGKPRAAKGGFPYPGHGSVKERTVHRIMSATGTKEGRNVPRPESTHDIWVATFFERVA